MSFYEEIAGFNIGMLREGIEACTAGDVERALGRERLEDDDVAALFSPAAAPYLEVLAQRAAALTERRFGKVIQLYTPLYISNECVNRCSYCGFAHHLEVARATLTLEQVLGEAQVLYDEGFRHILLVSGESRRHVPVDFLEAIARALHGRFDSIAIEIFPLETEEYKKLTAAGVDGLALYQETYDRALYSTYHPAGPKRDYRARLMAIERGGEAGMRSLGIGALLGLNDWRVEAATLAWHGRWLARKYWRSRVSVSFPRIREAAGHWRPPFPVSDRELVQMICAMRLALPDAELVMSTREPAGLRDWLIGLGITRMSAGSRTNPGGYRNPEAGGKQFEVEDARTPVEVAAMIRARGFEPVWKDFDRVIL